MTETCCYVTNTISNEQQQQLGLGLKPEVAVPKNKHATHPWVVHCNRKYLLFQTVPSSFALKETEPAQE